MSERPYGNRPFSDFSRSIELQGRATEEIPEAASSNYRGESAYAPYPMVYMEEGDGAQLTDVDGNEYIDFHGGVSAIILGHSPEHVVETVSKQVRRGSYFATSTEMEYEAARLLNEVLPYGDRAKFISTGTEAVMTALRLARAYTGKEKVLKFEGMYHGHSDDVLVNVHPQAADLGSRRNPTKIPESSGVPSRKMDVVETVSWNDADLLAERLERDGDEIAAVVTEAVMSNSGLVWPEPDYLAEVRRLTHEHDVLLVLDEVVTGFRMGLTGAQGYFDIEPDLAVYGKALANGYPSAALTGRAEIMDFIRAGPDGATVMGTFSGNPVAVAAAKATLEELQNVGQAGYDDLFDLGDRLVTGLREILTDAGHDVFVPDHAGFTYVHFTDGRTDPGSWTDWRDVNAHTLPQKYPAFAAEMMGEGIFMPPKVGRINLVHAHTDEHVDAALEAATVAAERIPE
jgi:glutamate-1-semialdehyde 2,1-aminomutase